MVDQSQQVFLSCLELEFGKAGIWRAWLRGVLAWVVVFAVDQLS